MKLNTEEDVRDSFWQTYPEFYPEYRLHFSQNDYRTDIRVTFCDFVDSLMKDGVITDELADNVTLQ